MGGDGRGVGVAGGQVLLHVDAYTHVLGGQSGVLGGEWSGGVLKGRLGVGEVGGVVVVLLVLLL